MPESAISWTRFTFNPWWGCVRVSRACNNCYAETWAARYGRAGLWRKSGPRMMMSDAYWREPPKWNRAAAAARKAELVFCASMADLFEAHPDPVVAAEQDSRRARLWDLAGRTPWLTWLLLTKRPHNVAGMVPWTAVDWPANVWVGTSTESQRWADERIPVLLRDVPAPVRFISAEPLVGPVDLRRYLTGPNRLEWVITGGESGPKAVPSHPNWFATIRDQTTAAGVPLDFKQWGNWSPTPPAAWVPDDADRRPARHCWVDAVTGATTPYAALSDPDPTRHTHMYRVGQKAAGNELDGRIWHEHPALAVAA